MHDPHRRGSSADLPVYGSAPLAVTSGFFSTCSRRSRDGGQRGQPPKTAWPLGNRHVRAVWKTDVAYFPRLWAESPRLRLSTLLDGLFTVCPRLFHELTHNRLFLYLLSICRAGRGARACVVPVGTLWITCAVTAWPRGPRVVLRPSQEQGSERPIRASVRARVYVGVGYFRQVYFPSSGRPIGPTACRRCAVSTAARSPRVGDLGSPRVRSSRSR
jgi:hypothetical protein